MGGRVLEQPSGRPAALDKQSDRLSLLEAQMKTLQKGISRVSRGEGGEGKERGG